MHGNPWVKSGPLSGLANKVLLNQAQTHSRTQHLQHICLSVLCISEAKSCHRDCVADKVWRVPISLFKDNTAKSHSKPLSRGKRSKERYQRNEHMFMSLIWHSNPSRNTYSLRKTRYWALNDWLKVTWLVNHGAGIWTHISLPPKAQVSSNTELSYETPLSQQWLLLLWNLTGSPCPGFWLNIISGYSVGWGFSKRLAPNKQSKSGDQHGYHPFCDCWAETAVPSHQPHSRLLVLRLRLWSAPSAFSFSGLRLHTSLSWGQMVGFSVSLCVSQHPTINFSITYDI